MGKRSDFKRRKNDFYTTWDKRAIKPLLPFIEGKSFYEPCAGDGALVFQLKKAGVHCTGMSDIDPKHSGVMPLDVFNYKGDNSTDCIITNPPWTREILHPLIDHLRVQSPTWLLFDAGWKHTIQKNMAKKNNCKTVPELLKYCSKIVSIGRLKWIPDSPYDAKDDCCWYLFEKEECKTEFIGR